MSIWVLPSRSNRQAMAGAVSRTPLDASAAGSHPPLHPPPLPGGRAEGGLVSSERVS